MVEREVFLPIERDDAWRLVTDQRELERWLAPSVELDPVVGGEITVEDADGVQVGVVEDLVDGERIAFRWRRADGGESTVVIDLDEVEGGTRVSVVERGAPSIELRALCSVARYALA